MSAETDSESPPGNESGACYSATLKTQDINDDSHTSRSVKRHAGWFRVYEEALRLIERTYDREAAVRKATPKNFEP